MICASCGATPAPPEGVCPTCGQSVLLDGRYRLEGTLGQGAFGTTWRATRVADGHPVCLKELLYQRLASFEPERMFRREAEVLRQLDVPGVPRYIDDFAVTTGRAVSLFIAQELVLGESLLAEARARRYREPEVLAILAELLRVLGGLHELAPPVVHRDVKPANVMRRRSDGRLVLVDFGSVKDVVRETISGGPSIAGTIGFMAPEQLQGRASPASDVYAAGVLAASLLSRREPSEMQDERGRLDWRSHVVVSAGTAQVLSRMLDPDPEARPQTGAEAAALVEQALRALTAPPRPAEAPQPAERSIRRAPRLDTQEREHPVAVGPELREAAPLAHRSEPLVQQGEPLDEHRSKTPLVVGALALAVLAVIIMVTAGSGPSPQLAAGTQPAVVVPQGLLGLRLGMTLDEARAAVPEVKDGAGVSPAFVMETGGIGFIHFGMAQLPGTRWEYRTKVVGSLATCQLDFAVADTLSRLLCTLDGASELAAHTAAESKILEQLRERYDVAPDPGCAPRTERSFGVTHERKCVWSGATARLELESRFQDFGGPAIGLRPTARLALSLTSRAHDGVEERIKSEARRQAQAKEAQEKAAREAKEAAERRRIESSGADRPL